MPLKKIWELLPPPPRRPSLRSDLRTIWHHADFRANEDLINRRAPKRIAEAVSNCEYEMNLDALRVVVNFVRSDAEATLHPVAADAAERVHLALLNERNRFVKEDEHTSE
jgi:hypothetical protein